MIKGAFRAIWTRCAKCERRNKRGKGEPGEREGRGEGTESRTQTTHDVRQLFLLYPHQSSFIFN